MKVSCITSQVTSSALATVTTLLECLCWLLLLQCLNQSLAGALLEKLVSFTVLCICTHLQMRCVKRTRV
jgi:hypothetical protein